jgi:hypothetical protein
MIKMLETTKNPRTNKLTACELDYPKIVFKYIQVAEVNRKYVISVKLVSGPVGIQ